MKGILLFLGILAIGLFNPIIALALIGVLFAYEIYLQNSENEKTDWQKNLEKDDVW